MTITPGTPPKPVTEHYRANIVRLPKLTAGRRLARWLLIALLRLLVFLLTRTRVSGLEHIPPSGGLLVVVNHLGDADGAALMARMPRQLDAFAKADLYSFPILGWLMDRYGVIWIHRGRPDRRAIRAGLEGLEAGRMIVIAPEGRESLTGALEEGTFGAAYLALKACVPVLPVTLTGTSNRDISSCLRRLHRAPVTVTIGPTFNLCERGNLRADLEKGTDLIMQTLAKQLPPQYRGVYKDNGDIE